MMKVRVAKQKRRGQTRWVVDWTDHSEKRHQPVFRTKEAAEAEAERIRITLRAQHGRSPELPEDTTWTGLFERVMRHRRDLKIRTLEIYRAVHARHLAPEFGATAVQNLTRLRLREFLRRQTFTNESIHDFAESIDIGPGIVVGRLQHDGVLKRHQGNRLKQKLDWKFVSEG